jgi:hypothetical protein
MTITIDARYNGPPDSGNGGYVAGRLAEALLHATGSPAVGPGTPWVEVTLRTPPPLDTTLTEAVDGRHLNAFADEVLVGEARILDDPPPQATPVEPVDLARATHAETSYLGLTTHPFPTCWVCGPSRPEHDGYDLRPGTVDGDRTACTWTVGENAAEPAGAVSGAAMWAALDCPGGWTALQGDAVLVLGRMAAQVSAVPVVGETCVVMGRLIGNDGRKSFTATTVYGADGTLLAQAVATWITIG